MKKYEMKQVMVDPFDIMCGECQEHEIEVWEEVSVEGLHEIHEQSLQADKWMTDSDKQQYEDMNGELEDIRDMAQDSLDNMPESLQESDTGQLLQERIDMLDGAIDELNSVEYGMNEDELHEEAGNELGEFNSESEYKTEEEYTKAIEEKVGELKEEKLEEYADAIDEALSSLEY